MLPEPGAGPPQGGRSPLGGPGAGDRGRGVVMSDRRNVLTPEALAMMDVIARTGSFAAAARELGKVPSALTYNVRQLEDALAVLLFDRRSRQAKLTAAGDELLNARRRLLAPTAALAH